MTFNRWLRARFFGYGKPYDRQHVRQLKISILKRLVDENYECRLPDPKHLYLCDKARFKSERSVYLGHRYHVPSKCGKPHYVLRLRTEIRGGLTNRHVVWL